MPRIFQYSGLITKIKGMESHLLKQKDYEELSTLNSVPDFYNYLKNIPQYHSLLTKMDEQDVHRIDLEHLLITSVLEDFIKIYKFSNPAQKKYLHIFFSRFEVDLLKKVLTHSYHHQTLDLQTLKENGFTHSKLNLEALSQADSLEKFLAAIVDTPYYNNLKALSSQEQTSLYDYESRLDVEYFTNAYHDATHIKSKIDRELLTAMLGTQIDYQNILWIYRCKRFYEMPDTLIMNHIIPKHYRLSASKLYQLVSASNTQMFLEQLQNTHYGYLTNHIQDLVLEKHFFQMRAKTLKYIRNQYPLSIDSVLYYLFEKELEIEQLTMVLECIRYQLTPNDIMRYLSSELVEDAT